MPFDSQAYVSAFGNVANTITSGAGLISRGISDWKQQKKEDRASRAIYDALTPEPDAGTGATAAHPFGMSKDEFDGLSRNDRIALTQGKVQALSIKQHMAQMKREQEDQQYQQTQRAAGARFGQLLQPPDYVDDAVDPVNPQPITHQRLLGAATQAGLDPRIIAQFAEHGADDQETNWQNVMPRPFEVGGVPGAVGKSGQFQFLPQTTPESLQAIPVMDDGGNIVGMRVPTGKGGSAPLPKPTTKTLPDSYNTRLTTLQDMLTGAATNAGTPDAELKTLKLSGTQDHYRKQVDKARKEIADHVARFEGQGYANPDFWQQEKQRLSLGAPAAATKVTTREQFDALPSGSTYTGKDGKLYRKP